MSIRCIAYVLLTLLIQPGAINELRAQESVLPAREYVEMLRSDLILRGRVQLVSEDFVPAELLEPRWTHGGACRIARITFSVSEVIFGSFNEATCEFIVDMSNSELQSVWTPGEDMVVSLLFRPEFQGGEYFVISNTARFVLKGSAWIRQGHVKVDHKFTLDEIRSIVAPIQINAVTASADIIAIGTIESVEEELVKKTKSGTARILNVTFEVDELVKGAGVGRTLVFQLFNGGSYWPSWAAPWPKQVETGKRYCLFLNQHEGKLYSAGGVNGLFSLEKDKLVRNSIVLPTSIERVRGLVKE